MLGARERAGDLRSGSRPVGVSVFACGPFNSSLHAAPDLGGRYRSDSLPAGSRHFLAAVILCSQLWGLGTGNVGFMGTAGREPPGFHPLLLFFPGYLLSPILFAGQPSGLSARLYRPTGIATAQYGWMEGTCDHRPFYISPANWQHRFSSAPLGAEEGFNRLSSETETLQKTLADLLSWERRKRREQILATLFCYAFVAALPTRPFHGFLETVISRWFIPILFFGLIAPFFLRRGRWRLADSARALGGVDKTLRLRDAGPTARGVVGEP